MTQETENRLQSPLNILKLPLNATKYYKLTPEQDWVKNLLIELNEKAEDKTPEDYLKETSINVELELLKKFNKEDGELLLVKGRLETEYATQCVRTLEDMNMSLEIDIQACFINSIHQDSDIYKDQLETFQENEMYELYFYEKNFVKIHEMVHEQVFLNVNQYPVKDADAPLPSDGTTH